MTGTPTGPIQLRDAAPPLEEELHLRHVLATLRRFLGSAVAAGAAMVVAIMLLVLTTPKRYEGATRITVVEHDPNLSVERNTALVLGQRTYIDTQVEILRSRPVARDALLELGLEGSPIVDPHPLTALLKRALRSLQSKDDAPPDIEDRVDELEELTKIRQVQDTDVIQIAVRARSPALARDLADKITEVFARRNLELKKSRTTSDRVYLTKRLESTKQSLIDAENDLRRFEEKHDAVSLEERLKYLIELLIQTEGELTDVDRQTKEISARLQVTLQQVSSAREGVAEAGSEAYAVMQQRLLDLRLKRESLLKTYTTNHPEVKQVDQEIRIVRTQVDSMGEAVRSGKSGTLTGMDQVLLQQSRLQQEFEALTSRAASLEAILAHYKAQLSESLALKSQFQFLAREMEANRKIYDLLLLRQKEASLKEDMLTSDISVIQASRLPRDPASPKPIPSLILALIAGVLAGLGTALLRDHLDQSVSSREALERALGLPCLAELPRLPEGEADPGNVLVGEGLDLVDQISSLDTSLSVDGPEETGKVFLVTSAVPSEGKSTAATCLAMSFALGKSRTLLVDCDLRKPSLLAKFDVGDEQPLLDDDRDDFVDALVPDASLPELTVVGVRKAEDVDPALVRQRRFARRLMQLRKRYDRIVIDSPPLTVFADALHLAPLADRVILLARTDHSTMPKVKEAARLLGNVRARLAGFVLNGIQAEDQRYGYAARYNYSQRGA